MYEDITKTEIESLKDYCAKELKKLIEDTHIDARDKLDAIRQLADIYDLYNK